MAFSEEILSLINDSGQMMYGVIHHPEKPNGSLVLMFNIGLHYRVCHSRLFVRQARELQEAGFVVVRMDPSRVGYSHGEIAPSRAIDNYDAVQTGLFKEDALLVVRHLRERFKPTKTFFTGLCGGGLTATITAALDKDVDGVVFIAGPVTVTSPEVELTTMHELEADVHLAGYSKRILSPVAWARFLSGKTSYRTLFDSVKTKFSARMAKKKVEPVADPSAADPEENKGDLLNRVFYRSFDLLMKTGKDVLFLMPELDRATYDFDKLFLHILRQRYSDYTDHYEIARVAKANHTFSTEASTRQLFDITSQWLIARMNR